MVLDYERMWLALKEQIVSKKSHGQKDLLKRMTEIELESRIDEGQEPNVSKATTADPQGLDRNADPNNPLTEGDNGYGSNSKHEALSGR